MFTSENKETAKALAFGLGLLAVFIVATTPVCVWLHGVDNCERMFCELLIMRRPMADVSYCEWWFDLFR